VSSRIWLVLQSAWYKNAGAGFSDTWRVSETTIKSIYVCFVLELILLFFFLIIFFYNFYFKIKYLLIILEFWENVLWYERMSPLLDDIQCSSIKRQVSTSWSLLTFNMYLFLLILSIEKISSIKKNKNKLKRVKRNKVLF